MERDASSMIQVGLDVLNTIVDSVTKSVLAYLGDNVGAEQGGEGAVDGDRAEWWQHVGFLSRPPKPEKGKKCAQTVIIRQTSHDVCIASRDLRGQDLAGELGYGETFLYAAGEDGLGQAKIKLCKDGSIAIYTKKGNLAAGAGMIVGLDPAADAIRITNSVGHGIIIDATGVKIIAGGSAIVVAPGGSAFKSASTLLLDGTVIALGGGAAPPPAGNVLCGPSGAMSKPSTKVYAE